MLGVNRAYQRSDLFDWRQWTNLNPNNCTTNWMILLHWNWPNWTTLSHRASQFLPLLLTCHVPYNRCASPHSSCSSWNFLILLTTVVRRIMLIIITEKLPYALFNLPSCILTTPKSECYCYSHFIDKKWTVRQVKLFG